MIENMKIRISPTEMREHLDKRADYHEQRAATKEAELPKVRDAMQTIKSSGEATAQAVGTRFSNSTSYRTGEEDPVANLEEDIRVHKQKADRFRFYMTHLIEDDYTLTTSELRDFEFIR